MDTIEPEERTEQDEEPRDPLVLLRINMDARGPDSIPALGGRIIECRYWTQPVSDEWVFAPYIASIGRYVGIRQRGCRVLCGDPRDLKYVPVTQLR